MAQKMILKDSRMRLTGHGNMICGYKRIKTKKKRKKKNPLNNNNNNNKENTNTVYWLVGYTKESTKMYKPTTTKAS